MPNMSLNDVVKSALEDMKGIEILSIDVSEITSIADEMVIATGTSSRHVKALCRSLVEKAKEEGFRPLSTEGEDTSDWILVDFGDTIVHLMLPETREFYDLESLWTLTPDSRQQDS